MKRIDTLTSSLSRSKPEIASVKEYLTRTKEDEKEPSITAEYGTLTGYYTEPQTFQGTDGDDNFTGLFGRDTMYGSDGADTFDGSSGSDTVDYSQSDEAVDVQLSRPSHEAQRGGDAQGDRLINVENVVGSSHDDKLGGSSASNRLVGGDGNDTFLMDAGADEIIGGADHDTLVVSGDNMTINLATGTGSGGDADGDTYSSIEQVNLTPDASGNTIIGSNASETVTTFGENNDIDLGGGSDTLNYWTNTSAGELDGGAGFDTVNFGLNPMIMEGIGPWAISGVQVDLENGTFKRFNDDEEGQITGFEHIVGTSSSDTFIDDRGNNKFTGGNGNDVFKFNHNGSGETDTVTDFEAGDKIDLSGIEGLTLANWFNEDLPFEIEDIRDILGKLGDPDVPDLLESWIEQDGDNVVIHTDFQAGDKIVLEGVSLEDISANDFIF
jgi:Ca2+-binding RTX toxin-like protein